MTETIARVQSDQQPSMRRTVRLSVEQFGPIKKGCVDLRPLTIFVGPSNTGKTYLSILIYALHKTLHGFPRLPFMERYLFLYDDLSSGYHEELSNFSSKLDDLDSPLLFSDLPELLRSPASKILQGSDEITFDIQNELVRCFDLDEISQLIRTSKRRNNTSLSLSVLEGGSELWNFNIGIGSSGLVTNGTINDVELFSRHDSETRKKYKRLALQLRRFLGVAKDNSAIRHQHYPVARLLYDFVEQQFEPHYLPAARSGIMQSHRVITSAFVARSTRAGLERLPELPTLSGVMVDFLQRLILYEAPRSGRRIRGRKRPSVDMQALAADLESRTLRGRIVDRRSSPGAYPEFVYQPLDAKQDIRLSRASSMVSELAPVVIFVRGNINVGDTLIIEEPEAHLHPAAQTEMASTLARLVKSGVRVVITTHSDWLLKEIGNLMREGELEDRAGASKNQTAPPNSLHPDDVGIWLFQEDGKTSGSTVSQIEFDRVEGIEPLDYEAISEELYNRSANLQNRFEEAVKTNR